jgi:hypothetical protein
MDSRLGFTVALALCLGCGPQVSDGVGAAEGSSGGTSSGGSEPGTTGGLPQPGTTEDPAPSTSSDDVTTSGDVASTGQGGSSGVAESSTGGAFELDCEARCSAPIDGSCIQDCASTCEQVLGGQPEPVADAFEACVSTEPLCFSSLEDCMWAELYAGERVEQSFTLEGRDFADWEGATVYARLVAGEDAADTVSAQIVFGGFSVQSTVDAAFDVFWNPRTYFFFVDVNEDGECTPGTDFVRSAMLATLGTDFAEPSFVIEASSDGASLDGFCSEF